MLPLKLKDLLCISYTEGGKKNSELLVALFTRRKYVDHTGSVTVDESVTAVAQ